MSNIFIITCNAKKNSLKAPFVNAYSEAAEKAGHTVRTVNVYDLDIDYLRFDADDVPYKLLPPALKEAQDNILWADTVVFAYPIWMYAIPAKLKAFIERVFQQDVVATYGKYGPEPLLTGRKAVIIQSYDMPYIYMRLLYGDAPYKSLRVLLSNWCGLKIVKRFDLDMISNMSGKKKEKLMREITAFAAKK